ncbi:MAG: lipid-A-disaccharide synthase [Eudoraea sp.]|nr:lipid-A-disaccharide synthase [Eudoraea sp.]
MKYYIISGEASGDLHGSNLIRALKSKDPEAQFRGWGGDHMAEAGATLVKHIKETAFMGFLEVALNVRTITRNIRLCKEDIESYQPDALIFIDYSGFNLRIAQWAKPKGFKTHYYISPQLWASRANRIEKIKSHIDHMYVILPFEKEFYTSHGFEVNYVGHPLLDAIQRMKPTSKEEFRASHGLVPDKDIIALLPGSRKQEIQKVLPVMLSAAKAFTDYQFVIAGAPTIDPEYYRSFISGVDVTIIQNDTYSLLSHAHAALVTSGTATLETALFGVPQVVCYKGSWFSYQIAKRLITLEYISLVNLIMDKEVVKELIQKDLTSKNIQSELEKILSGTERELQKTAYNLLQQRLGSSGASERAAALIIENS